MPDVLSYLKLVQGAYEIASDLGSMVKDAVIAHASRQLTPEEMAQLKAAWQRDVDESAKNAGL